MKPLLKWPGGKSKELIRFYGMIPQFDRYIEPFFGGGALYFHLTPLAAAVNDLSSELMDFYGQVREGSEEFRRLLLAYAGGFQGLVRLADRRSEALTALLGAGDAAEAASTLVASWHDSLAPLIAPLAVEPSGFYTVLSRTLADKLQRTAALHEKKSFSPADLRENLITGLAGGYYLYFRERYNDYLFGRETPTAAERAANFFFIREMCYGSMFRYNAQGAFNIPYGGMSYNHKDLLAKAEAVLEPQVQELLQRTDLYNLDFEEFLLQAAPTERDFLFLDPPYDTEFSDYVGASFTKLDQARLAVALSRTKARFLLVIKNTDFIQGLYGQGFHLWKFDKQYAYNVRRRNDRSAEHLIVTNYSLPL